MIGNQVKYLAETNVRYVGALITQWNLDQKAKFAAAITKLGINHYYYPKHKILR